MPGGGYARLAIDHEGKDVARRLSSLGYDSFVLKYRLPNDACMSDKRFGPIEDVYHSIKYIRDLEEPVEIVLLGFSAGGHLVSTAVNLSNDETLKGDYNILIYPVISMQNGVTHKGSKKHLLGDNVSQEDIDLFSSHLQVNSSTPPTFIMHSKDDKAVPIENSYLYKEALDQFGIPNQMFVYEKGGHGFGMVNPLDEKDWFDEMIRFISIN